MLPACRAAASCRTLNRLNDFDFAALFIALLVILFSLTVHEAAHAWTAERLGDQTARRLGRVSLNPLVHIDPIGTVVLPIVAFSTGAPIIGWAKPVPVDLRNLTHWKRDFMVIAAAGPASNLVLAVLAAVGLRIAGGGTFGLAGIEVGEPVVRLLFVGLQLNLLLALFNLIPVPPLDGGNIVGGLLRGAWAERFDAIRPYGIFVLYALLLTGTLSAIIGPPYVFLARWLIS